MKVLQTDLPGVLLLEPDLHEDTRGLFFESFNQRDFNAATQTSFTFVQDNQSHSRNGVLRGLHYQSQQPQGKLVRVISGRIWDVVVDIRRSSPHFSHHACFDLTAAGHRQLWIPPGFAHGFLVLSESAEVVYKTTDYYAAEYERCIRWDDPQLAIEWPLQGMRPVLSARDREGLPMALADLPG